MNVIKRWVPVALLIFIGAYLLQWYVSTTGGPYERCREERYGIVTNVEAWPLGRLPELSGDESRVTVTFEYIGAKYKAPIYMKTKRPPDIGDRMKIRFDPENPTWAVGANTPLPASRGVLSFGIVTMAAGLMLVRRGIKLTQKEHEAALEAKAKEEAANSEKNGDENVELNAQS